MNEPQMTRMAVIQIMECWLVKLGPPPKLTDRLHMQAVGSVLVALHQRCRHGK